MTRLKFDKRPKRAKKSPRKYSSIKRPTYAESLVRAAATTRKPVKKKPRPKDETLRIYGPPERREWMKRQPCIVSRDVCHIGEMHGHHIKTDGVSRKADARFQVPLCAGHHSALHLHGKQTFESFYGVALETAAAKCELAWQKFASADVRGSLLK